ncbi:MAG: hypothetical protein AAFR93_11730, partial [Pseudomonadota bacterium]
MAAPTDPATLLVQTRKDLLQTGTALPLLRATLEGGRADHGITRAACRELQRLGYWDQSILQIEAALERFPDSVPLHLLAAYHDPTYLGLAESLALETGKGRAEVADALREKGAVREALALLQAGALADLSEGDLRALAECHIALRDLPTARQVVLRLADSFPKARTTALMGLRLAWLDGGTVAVRAWAQDNSARALSVPHAVFRRLVAGRDLQGAADWVAQVGHMADAPAILALHSARPEQAEALIQPILAQTPPEARSHALWDLAIRAALALGPGGDAQAADRLAKARLVFPDSLTLDQLAAERALQLGDWTGAERALSGRPGPSQTPQRAAAQAELAHRMGRFAPGATGA